jgi:hypothetical protein
MYLRTRKQYCSLFRQKRSCRFYSSGHLSERKYSVVRVQVDYTASVAKKECGGKETGLLGSQGVQKNMFHAHSLRKVTIFKGHTVLRSKQSQRATGKDLQEQFLLLLSRLRRRVEMTRKISPSLLRDTFVVRYLQAGGDLCTVRELLNQQESLFIVTPPCLSAVFIVRQVKAACISIGVDFWNGLIRNCSQGKCLKSASGPGPCPLRMERSGGRRAAQATEPPPGAAVWSGS